MTCVVETEQLHSPAARISLSYAQRCIGGLVLSVSDGYGYQQQRKPQRYRRNVATTSELLTPATAK